MRSFPDMFKALLIVLLLSSPAFGGDEITLGQQRESTLYATLCALGFSQSTAVVTDNEVLVDYVIPPIESDIDLALQLQAIFIAAAKIAPDTVLTVVKGRYRSEYPPMFVAAIPNDVTQRYAAGAIEPMAFWQLVAINDKALLEATQRQERSGLQSSRKAMGGGEKTGDDTRREGNGSDKWLGIFGELFKGNAGEKAEEKLPARSADEKGTADKTPAQQKDEFKKSVEELQKSIDNLGNTLKGLFR